MTLRRQDRTLLLVLGISGPLIFAGVFLLARDLTPPRAAPPRPAKKAPSPAERISRRVAQNRGYSPAAARKRSAHFAAHPAAAPWVRLPPPDPGDWLFRFKEPGQTLAEYRRELKNRKRAGRNTLHLLPYTDLSPAQRAVLPALRRFTELYFATDTLLLPAEAPDPAWFDAQRQQVDAEKVVEHLASWVPEGSLGLFGLLGRDLYVERLNFVFGLALLERRASAHSLRRYGQEPRALLRRAMKLTAHELGHVFGIRHCVFYRCVMNGANSLFEADRAPLHLCPLCLAKLRENVGFEPAARYRRLAAFYAEQGMDAEAAFARSQAAGTPQMSQP